jgi:putative GTP pyrophosphokinase
VSEPVPDTGRQPDQALVDACVEVFRSESHAIKIFGHSVREFFASHPELNSGEPAPIHSVRYRVKSEEHLREKITRKKTRDNRDITPDNLLEEVTDLFGVRVLHLHLQQLATIDDAIRAFVRQGHLAFFEKPKAYTWDPENTSYLAGLGLEVVYRENHYTSIHYVVKPNAASRVTCEVQVRTLFEEAWGEIDHVLNYPVPTPSVACREQLRVMAKMMGAGSRLAEAIFRSHREHRDLVG